MEVWSWEPLCCGLTVFQYIYTDTAYRRAKLVSGKSIYALRRPWKNVRKWVFSTAQYTAGSVCLCVNERFWCLCVWPFRCVFFSCVRRLYICMRAYRVDHLSNRTLTACGLVDGLQDSLNEFWAKGTQSGWALCVLRAMFKGFFAPIHSIRHTWHTRVLSICKYNSQ